MGWNRNPQDVIPSMIADAQKLIAFDASEPTTHSTLACVCLITRRYEEAIAAARRAITLNPSFALAHYIIGPATMFDGRPREAIDAINRAVRLSPNDSMMFTWLPTLAASHYMLHEYELALEIAEQAIRLNPRYPLGHRGRVSALAQLGRMDEA